MPRTQSLVVAVSLGLAAVFGVLALTKTVHLGQKATAGSVSQRVIAKRTAQLDRVAASLRAELRKRPPEVPKLSPVPAALPASGVLAATPAPAPVVYQRPAPIVIHLHHGGAGHEGEGSDQREGRGGGGGDD